MNEIKIPPHVERDMRATAIEVLGRGYTDTYYDSTLVCELRTYYRAGFEDGRSAAHTKEKLPREPRVMGKNQKAMLRRLRERGVWHPGCGWYWDHYSGTVKLLDSLVRRGVATKTTESVGPVYRPTKVAEEQR